MDKHFTVSCYIIQQQKCLLLFHPKFQMWLQPGGHLEENETPVEGVLREVWEETGLEIELLSQENIWIDRWNAKSFTRPYLCAVEKINDAHFHMDLIYVGRPCGGELHVDDNLRWFSLDELLALKTDAEVFGETQEIAAQILEKAPQDLSLSYRPLSSTF